MCAVPRVLEKVYLGILGNRNAAPPARQKIFDWAFSIGKQVSKYHQRHEPVPMLLAIKNAVANKLVFSKIQAVLDGRTHKEVAFDLGVATATVRVLYSRAMKKLGRSRIQSRAEAA
jgi:long-chain acyl-CoA synthetase